VSGQSFMKYGGNTTCIEVRTANNDVIIIDAGSGIRELGNMLAREKRDEFSILFTHYHWDHTLGLPFFPPIYTSGVRIKLYGYSHRGGSLKETIGRLMSAPYFPVDFYNIKSDITYYKVSDSEFQINSLSVTPIHLNHPNLCLGYKLVEDNICVVFFTDNELTSRHSGSLDYVRYLDFTRSADLLVHDAQYTPKEYEVKNGWGHSVYTDALKLALEAGVSRLGLFHHNPERTDTELDNIVKKCNQVKMDHGASLDCFAVYDGMEINL
jgi:phosphoribosyl 1,2-cyclic phosphodiesterase